MDRPGTNRIPLCLAALLLAAAAPERAPARFTTLRYQLTVRIPPGLFHCRYPARWAGGDHGISLYMVKPAACDPAAPAAPQDIAGHLPQIRFYYAPNDAPVADPGSAPHTPRRNTELHRQGCGEAPYARPPPMAMLGAAAATCFEHHGDMIALAAGTLYRQAIAPMDPPDSQAWLILQTTARRYPYDLKLFQTILRTIAVCRAEDRPPQPPRPTCPPLVQW